MGRSQSLAYTFMSGVRVAGKNGVDGVEGCPIRFTPAHHDLQGKPVSSKAEFSIYRNTVGENGRSDPFRVTAWNNLAETCCKSLTPGKAIDILAEPQSYLGKSFDENRNPRLDTAGQPLLVRKVGFTILRIAFGEDAEKRIIYEMGFPDKNSPRVIWEWRPKEWEHGKQNHDTWQAIRNARNTHTWDGRADIFGYARVIIPQGKLDWTKINGGKTQHLAGTQPQPQQYNNVQAPAAPSNDTPAAILSLMRGGGNAPAMSQGGVSNY